MLPRERPAHTRRATLVASGSSHSLPHADHRTRRSPWRLASTMVAASGLAEGRAEPTRADADLLQAIDRPVQIRPHPPRGTGEMMRVVIAVGLDLVPPTADLVDQFGMPCHLRTEAEERGGQGQVVEAVEHRRSGPGVRTVVEGQCDRVSAARPPSAKVERQDAEGQPLSQTDDAGNHMGTGDEADRDQCPSRPRVPWRASDGSAHTELGCSMGSSSASHST